MSVEEVRDVDIVAEDAEHVEEVWETGMMRTRGAAAHWGHCGGAAARRDWDWGRGAQRRRRKRRPTPARWDAGYTWQVSSVKTWPSFHTSPPHWIASPLWGPVDPTLEERVFNLRYFLVLKIMSRWLVPPTPIRKTTLMTIPQFKTTAAYGLLWHSTSFFETCNKCYCRENHVFNPQKLPLPNAGELSKKNRQTETQSNLRPVVCGDGLTMGVGNTFVQTISLFFGARGIGCNSGTGATNVRLIVTSINLVSGGWAADSTLGQSIRLG